MGWLDGMAALLVGGGSGIGRAAVDAFVQEGARVAVLDIDRQRCAELDSLGDVVAVQGDATIGADNESAVRATLSAFGRLDTLVTFVGAFDYHTPLRDIDSTILSDAADEAFRVNVHSSLLAVKAALGPLADARGSVVLTLSTSSFHPGRGGVLYVASKFALRGVVLQLAHELAPDIRVNGVAPGGTLATELRGLRTLDLADRRLGDTPERERQLIERTPLGVALRPEDHAGAYVLLASPRARGTTGTVVTSDGGHAVR